MRNFKFTEDEIQTFAHQRYHHPHVQKKMEVMWLKSQGEPNTRIAVLAGVGRTTVQRYLNEYLDGGIDQLMKLNWSGPTSELKEYCSTIKEEFEKAPPQTVAEACARIKTLTGIERKPTQVRKFMRDELGMRFRKVGSISVPPKKSPEEHVETQESFLYSAR